MQYISPVSPDQCWDAIRSCPETADQELITLCVRGPANYINITGTIYRNQFCAMCHNAELSLSEKADYLPRPPYNGIQFVWKNLKLYHQENATKEESEILFIARPKISKGHQLLSLKSSESNNFNSTMDKICYMFANPAYDFCPNSYYIYTRDKGNISTKDPPVWDLSSLNCYSPHPKVCDLFIKHEGDGCGPIGCKKGKLLDLETLDCISNNDFTTTSSVYHADLPWHSEPLCAYTSRCRAVDLGLIREDALNCYCDKFCVYFNDCCADSPFRPSGSEPLLTPGTFSCVSNRQKNPLDGNGVFRSGFFYGVMEVDKCPQGYTNKSIQMRCESSSTDKLSLLNTPVSDVKSGLRYIVFGI